MLNEDVDRYIALRRTLGYKLRKPARNLQAFARYADVSAISAYETAHGFRVGRISGSS